MKVYADADELYPHFTFDDDPKGSNLSYGPYWECDVPEETYERWFNIRREWRKMQRELKEAIGYEA